MLRFIFFTLFLILNLYSVHCQETKVDSLIIKAEMIKDDILEQEHDTTYIKSYADKITLKLLAENKFNTLGLYEGNIKSRIRYVPDLGVTFGIGFAYKAFALDLKTNLGLNQNNISSADYTDFQFRVFTSKHYVRLRYQYYLGYKINYIKGYDEGRLDDYKIRNDLRTMQFGIQYLYSFNYGKFSIKAPFVMNERQKKSAGSPVAGFNFLMYAMNADSSLVPNELEQQSTVWNDFSQLNVILLSFNFGYMHSYVIKEHFFISFSVIPGIGIKSGDYRLEERTKINNSLLLRMKSMNAIGYNGNRFFAGLQLIAGLNYLPLKKDLRTNIIEGRSNLFIGYRF